MVRNKLRGSVAKCLERPTAVKVVTYFYIALKETVYHNHFHMKVEISQGKNVRSA